MTSLWEYKRSEKETQLEKNAVQMLKDMQIIGGCRTHSCLATFSHRPRIPCFQAGHMTMLSVNWVYYITSPIRLLLNDN